MKGESASRVEPQPFRSFTQREKFEENLKKFEFLWKRTQLVLALYRYTE